MRFRPLQRIPARGSGFDWPSLPHPTACVSRFSQPPDASIRPEPADLVSCQIRSWGSPSRAFLLPRSRTPFPAPTPLMALGSPHEPHDRSSAKSHVPRKCANTSQRCIVWPAKQPPPTGSFSTRESATERRWFRPPMARSSPGPFPLQGVLPRWNERGVQPHLPSCGYLVPDANGRLGATPGSRFQTR